MHSSGSVILTILERLRAYLDDPDVDGKFSNDYIVRHIIGPAQADIMSRLNNTTECPILHTFDVKLYTDQTRYKLPPAIMEIVAMKLVDEDGLVQGESIPMGVSDPRGQNWALEGVPGAMELYIPTNSSWTRGDINGGNGGLLQLWYVSSGDFLSHYCATDVGGSTTRVSVTTATWDDASLTLTKTGGFTNYTFKGGDRITITAATGGTLGVYEVTGKTSNDAITLRTSLGASVTAATVSGRLWTRTFTLTSGTPTLGGKDRRLNAYAGGTLRTLPTGTNDFIEERVIRESKVQGTDWVLTLATPLDVGAATTGIPYEVTVPGAHTFVDAIAAWGAMKMGTSRKISQAQMQSLKVQYLASLKSILDLVTNIQTRMPKRYQRRTLDNPTPGYWMSSQEMR